MTPPAQKARKRIEKKETAERTEEQTDKKEGTAPVGWNGC